MLSRTASSLYWLGRYIERADFIARLVEATVRLDVLSPRPAGEAAWASALAVTETDEAFAASKQTITQQHVARFLTLDSSHPGSIVRCLDMARNNARAVRTALTREAWTAINRAWLIFDNRASPGGAMATLGLVDAVKTEARGFEGAIHRMLRNQTTWFIRLGQAVERADNTARLLDVKFHAVESEYHGGSNGQSQTQGQGAQGGAGRDIEVDFYHWSGILRSVSGFEVYRKAYRNVIRPEKVAELLILRPDMPRSLAACMHEVLTNLKMVANEQSADTLRRAGRLQSDLQYGRIDEILATGLHAYLTQFLERVGTLGVGISRDFLVPVAA